MRCGSESPHRARRVAPLGLLLGLGLLSLACSGPRRLPLPPLTDAGTGGVDGGSDLRLDGGGGGTDGGGAGTGGTPGTFCQQQTRPMGVAATDYQCVDFDTGLPPTTIWPQTLAGAGSLSASTARAISAPTSLLASVGSEADFSHPQTATLTWSDVGATAISGVSVTVQVNPVVSGGVSAPWTGSVDLLCVKYGGNSSCLSYTIGDPTMGGTSGYYLRFVFSGGAAFAMNCPISGAFTTNLWNPVTLLVHASGGTDLTINGTASPSCPSPPLTDTAATVVIGPAASGTTNAPFSTYLDNLIAAVQR
jgi:hypothetical protein